VLCVVSVVCLCCFLCESCVVVCSVSCFRRVVCVVGGVCCVLCCGGA